MWPCGPVGMRPGSMSAPRMTPSASFDTHLRHGFSLQGVHDTVNRLRCHWFRQAATAHEDNKRRALLAHNRREEDIILSGSPSDEGIALGPARCGFLGQGAPGAVGVTAKGRGRGPWCGTARSGRSPRGRSLPGGSHQRLPLSPSFARVPPL